MVLSKQVSYRYHDKRKSPINGLFAPFMKLCLLFKLAPCKSILNAFVYGIYQRVSILFELSVKHTLSDFLLPFRCHKYTINLLINQDLIWATKVSFIFLFKSLIFLNWETFISLTITSCNLSGMSAETNSRYLVII